MAKALTEEQKEEKARKAKEARDKAKAAKEAEAPEKDPIAEEKKSDPALKPGRERRVIDSDQEVMELQRKRLLCAWNPATRVAEFKKEE